MTQRTVTIDDAGTLHEQYTAQIWVGKCHLGQVVYDSGRADLRWHRGGYSFFCRHCGDIWAKLVAADSAGEVQTFKVLWVNCSLHPSEEHVPGSLLADKLINLLGDMPRAVVEREFKLHLEAGDECNETTKDAGGLAS